MSSEAIRVRNMIRISTNSASRDDREALRGRFLYKGEDFSVILRQAWLDGSARVDLYAQNEVNAEAFRRGERPAKEPKRSFLLRTDDPVSTKTDGDDIALALFGEKRYSGWGTRTGRRGITLKPNPAHREILLSGSSEWQELETDGDTVNVWLSVTRLLQTAGTCLQTG